jgi:hypothetical protein
LEVEVSDFFTSEVFVFVPLSAGLSVVVLPLTVIWERICFIVPGPIPGTFSSSSTDLKSPFFLR